MGPTSAFKCHRLHQPSLSNPAGSVGGTVPPDDAAHPVSFTPSSAFAVQVVRPKQPVPTHLSPSSIAIVNAVAALPVADRCDAWVHDSSARLSSDSDATEVSPASSNIAGGCAKVGGTPVGSAYPHPSSTSGSHLKQDLPLLIPGVVGLPIADAELERVISDEQQRNDASKAPANGGDCVPENTAARAQP